MGPFLSDKKMSEATEWGIKAMRTKTPSQRTQMCIRDRYGDDVSSMTKRRIAKYLRIRRR